MKLYRSFKDVPDDFDEIGRQLSSFYIVLCDLEHEASDPKSLLNRRGASRKDELLKLRDNLKSTMEELERLFETYTRIGKGAWRRIQLGQKDLEKPRRDLLFHMSAINGFISSLTMAAVGRVEQSLEVLEALIREFLLRDNGRAQTLRSEAPGSEETWELLRMNLASENIVLAEHEDDVRTIIESLMEEDLSDMNHSTIGDAPRTHIDNVATEHFSHESSSNERQQPLEYDNDDFDAAASSSSLEEAERVRIVLLNHGFDIDRFWNQASPSRSTAILKSIRSILAPNDLPEVRAFCWAAKTGHTAAARILLEKGVSLHKLRSQQFEMNAVPILVQASLKGHIDIVKLLLDHGASTEAVFRRRVGFRRRVSHPNSRANAQGSQSPETAEHNLGGCTALYAAAKNGHVDIVKLLLKKGADFNAVKHANWTPLRIAVSRGHIEVIQALLAAGAPIRRTQPFNLSASGYEFKTLLHVATGKNLPAVAAILLDHGDNLKATYEGKTPIDVAIANNYTSVAKELLAREIVPIANSFRIHQAVQLDKAGDRIQLIELLLSYGAEVDLCDRSQETPLYQAMDQEKEQMIEVLLRNHASLTLSWLIAVSRRNKKVMKRAVFMGVDLRAKDSNGIDALSLMINPQPTFSKIVPRRPEELLHYSRIDIQGLRFLLFTLGLRLGGIDNYGGKQLLYVVSWFCDITTIFPGMPSVEAIKLLIKRGAKFDNESPTGRKLIFELERLPLNGGETVLPLLRGAALRP